MTVSFHRCYETNLIDFAGHVSRVASKYKAVRKVKNKLRVDHALIQMGFSETYTFRTIKKDPVSLLEQCHGHILFFDCLLQGQREQFTAPTLCLPVRGHNVAMVFAILKKACAYLKDIVTELKWAVFLTDSPSSHYRNKTVFDLTARISKLFEIQVS